MAGHADDWRLDAAVTSKLHRPQFLQSLQNMRSTIVSNYGFSKSRFWRWLSVRKVYVESALLLDGGVVRSDSVIPSMRNVRGHNFADEDIWYLVRNCSSL